PRAVPGDRDVSDRVARKRVAGWVGLETGPRAQGVSAPAVDDDDVHVKLVDDEARDALAVVEVRRGVAACAEGLELSPERVLRASGPDVRDGRIRQHAEPRDHEERDEPAQDSAAGRSLPARVEQE